MELEANLRQMEQNEEDLQNIKEEDRSNWCTSI
jgi:hypothetical protein